MKRREFVKTTSLFSLGLSLTDSIFAINTDARFVSCRPLLADRTFTSESINSLIDEIKKQIKDPEIAWMFENCLPNTLDTTITYSEIEGKPDTFVITGDIKAMWLRDSTAQVWPYMPYILKDEKLKKLIQGVINRQTTCVLLDPYANAFMYDMNEKSEWEKDNTKMKSGIHERKWEIDSLCYVISLAHKYWKITGDTTLFDNNWKLAIQLILNTFIAQQKKNGTNSDYRFQRLTRNPKDTQAMNGNGWPVNPVGLICSAFRPSDDSTLFQFLIPSNFFAVESLKKIIEIYSSLFPMELTIIEKAQLLKSEVEKALTEYAYHEHPIYGKMIAYEVDGNGSRLFMDDANVPSLLALPYLGCISATDKIYINTRKYIFSKHNPFFFSSNIAEGIGGPHTPMGNIWPISIIMQGLTSTNENEIRNCLKMLKKTHSETGFMHESFNKDNPSNYTRKWFAWANSMFGEFILKINTECPKLLKEII